MTTWVLFAGLPGTGKSTLAAALAQPLDAAILDKDRVRAALFPGPFTDYSGEQNKVCMRAMIQAAVYLTDHQRTAYIFFDGRTFSTRKQREEVVGAAEEAGAGWRILHLQCADEVAVARLAKNDPAHPARDREPALYYAMRDRFEPIQHPALVVDTTLGFASQVPAIVAYLRSCEPAPSLTARNPTDILP